MAGITGLNSDRDFTAELFKAADKLRGNLEPSEYKHVALGLIFLKYISDAFDGLHAALTANADADAEDPEEYLAENVFWVPKEARWAFLQANAKRPEIGKLIDDAMDAIEKAPSNEGLKGVLPKNYARPTLNKTMLGELIDLFSNIGMHDSTDKAKDLLGRVYEYFLSGFAVLRARSEGYGEDIVLIFVGRGPPFTTATILFLLVIWLPRAARVHQSVHLLSPVRINSRYAKLPSTVSA